MLRYLFLIVLFSCSVFGFDSQATMTVDDFAPTVTNIFTEIEGDILRIDIYAEDENSFREIEDVDVLISYANDRAFDLFGRDYQQAEFVTGSGTTAQYKYLINMSGASDALYKIDVKVSDGVNVDQQSKTTSYPKKGLGTITGAFTGADNSRVFMVLKQISNWFSSLFS